MAKTNTPAFPAGFVTLLDKKMGGVIMWFKRKVKTVSPEEVKEKWTVRAFAKLNELNPDMDPGGT